jgi:hypothetical protein
MIIAKKYVMQQMTSAEFEELLDHGWSMQERGGARVLLQTSTAARLLARMKRNRPEKPRTQEKIVGALQGGYFRENGEPIILNQDLEPIDGQNRLQACITSGLPLPVVILWGWPDACFDTIDTGTKRSGGDMFAADGEPNHNLLSAAARYDWRIMRKDMLSGKQIPEPLMRDYLAENAGLRAACSWGAKVAHLIPKGLAVALYYRFHQQDGALANTFFTELSKGENINAREHTTWHLRDLLITRQSANLHLNNVEQAHIASYVIKAWHSVKAGKVIEKRQLLWRGTDKNNPEPFPDIKA